MNGSLRHRFSVCLARSFDVADKHDYRADKKPQKERLNLRLQERCPYRREDAQYHRSDCEIRRNAFRLKECNRQRQENSATAKRHGKVIPKEDLRAQIDNREDDRQDHNRDDGQTSD